MSDPTRYHFTSQDGRVWPVPAVLFESYAERVTLWTAPNGSPMFEITRPEPPKHWST